MIYKMIYIKIVWPRYEKVEYYRKLNFIIEIVKVAIVERT